MDANNNLEIHCNLDLIIFYFTIFYKKIKKK